MIELKQGDILHAGRFITGYGDAEDKSDRQIKLLPEVLPKAQGGKFSSI